MAIVRYDPILRSLFQMPDFWEDREISSNIPVDLEETNDEVMVKATVPGVKPEDLDITITGDTITLKYETMREEEKKDKKTYVSERYYGSFARSLTLPAAVNTDKAKTSFENGVLTISLPKLEEVKPKKIKVKVA